MKYYFAYGSNLNKEQMKARCKDAKVVGPLILPHARLVFRGVADVEWHETEKVHGGLWRISDRDERALDRYEGVSHKLYRKVQIRIAIRKNGNREERNALVYVMNRDHYAMPDQSYYDTIATGFEDFKLDKAALIEALTATSRECAKRPAELSWTANERCAKAAENRVS